MAMQKSPKIGLALGSGASRGWSHVGVIDALIAEGIEPDVICGTSVGAMVGASYLAGNLAKLEDWVLGSSRSDVYRFFDIKFSQSGFVDVGRLDKFINDFVVGKDVEIEQLAKPFHAVATCLNTGQEVWSRSGNVAIWVRASMSLPGLFPPVRHEDRWLVDGGLVNPVPVSTCRALGADIVIAVNLNSDIVGKRPNKKPAENQDRKKGVLHNLKQTTKEMTNSIFPDNDKSEEAPGLFISLTNSINIVQDRITRSR